MSGGSVDLVNAELDRFLTDPSPDVLAISGDWGSGKTFAWEAALKRIQNDPAKKLARPGYSYVSLFGVGSIAQLKLAIFQHSESIGGAAPTAKGKKPQESDGSLNLRSLATKLRLIPGVKDYADAAEELMALEIRDRLICFDDLERMSPSLALTEVLGLASFLKERRNCKIVFIAHTDKLSKREEFDRLSEKVVDISLRFVRTPEDAASLAITNDTTLAQTTRDRCVALGITNIRVIRQIWRLAQSLHQFLQGYEEAVRYQGIHSLVLYSWCHFQPNTAPSKDFVKVVRTALMHGGTDGVEINGEQQAWNGILNRYGFGYMDEFDEVVFRGVEHGYFDPAGLTAVCDQKNSLAISEMAGSSVQAAWDEFHNSFTGTAGDVASAIYESVKKHAKFVTPMNLDGAVRLIKELGQGDRALDLLKHYIEVHAEDAQIFDLDSYSFRGNIHDPDVIAAFKAKFREVPDARDPLDVIIAVSKNGMRRSDFLALRGLTAGELVSIFERAGPNTRRAVQACLEIITPDSPEAPPEQSVAQRTKEALLIIGRQTLLNRQRVKRYGITDAELDSV